MTEPRVSATGRVLIPVEIRQKYGLQPGARIRFVERPGEVAIQNSADEFRERPTPGAGSSGDALAQSGPNEAIRAMCGMLRSSASTSATAELLKDREWELQREEGAFGTGCSR